MAIVNLVLTSIVINHSIGREILTPMRDTVADYICRIRVISLESA
jgi:hypothetical protein